MELTDLTLRFILSDCDVSFANSLRRVMIAEVPVIQHNILSDNGNSLRRYD